MFTIPSPADYATYFKRLTIGVFLPLLIGCEADLLTYAGKQGIKQGSLIIRSQEVEPLIADPNTPENVRHYLKLSQEIIQYAENELKMNTGESYRKYIHLNRNWITQIVIAAKKDSFSLVPFKFPIVGEVPYKGFFDEADAVREETRLKKQDLDTYRRGAPAYSSLGWFADPLYNTMFKGEAYFVELLLHELVHLNFYFKSMADFNEAFATWFSAHVSKDFIEQSKMIKDKTKALKDLSDSAHFDQQASKFALKAISIAKSGYKNKEARESIFLKINKLSNEFSELKNYRTKTWNNASLLALSTYYELVPKIEAFAQHNKLTPNQLLKDLVQHEEAKALEILK